MVDTGEAISLLLQDVVRATAGLMRGFQKKEESKAESEIQEYYDYELMRAQTHKVVVFFLLSSESLDFFERQRTLAMSLTHNHCDVGYRI
ncbi:hypothetical protein HPP92_028792 [Vanilla planifolia]|uniref:Uncharacterized protein n=1 Tax=Vanilla planifolia TaxID=51239 RepID=A0A835P6R0_VANPL|nr:hypothetical protein HPP92_028792 [Vanilla planifolia]KAG0446557.1 hypothetical protein HPP92_028781 [Vanilla planifolia]